MNTSLSIALTLFLAAPIAVARGNYSIENIEPPPTKHGTSQIDGMCFTKDGKLAVCLPCGEIWLRDLKAGTWSLFAEGLHTPLGIIPEGDNGFIVTQRPELTLIKDTDGDGTADSYLCLSDEFGMTGNYHEFNFTPVRNENGDIFFGLGTASSGAGICDIIRGTYNANGRPGRMHSAAPYRGWIMKYSPLDGSLTPWSSGHRTPNGLGFDLEGKLYATDNQGDWVGTSKLFHVQQGNFYGHAASLNWKPEITTPALNLGAEKLDSLRTRAAVLLPQGTMANSPTEPLVDSTKGAFGPFSGQLFLGEMNQARLMRVLLEEVDGQMQGACVPFYDKGGLSLGTNRMAFAPDGSLYLGQTKHSWAGGSGIQRIVWDKKTPMDILSMNLTEKGFKLTFTKPLEPQSASTVSNYKFTRYWYDYHQAYGSGQYEVSDVGVSAVTLSPDGKSVTIALDELRPWFVHELNLSSLQSTDGAKLENTMICYTLNRLLKNTPAPPRQWDTKKPKK